MRVLITRPRQDAEPLAALLAAGGVDSLIEPLLAIDYEDGPAVDLAGAQALLATSANGVRALVHRNTTGDRGLPVYAVGDATAGAAREAGFRAVVSAGGDVEELARRLTADLDPKGGALVHMAGSRVAGDLAGKLEKAGFTYRRMVLYGARTAADLSGPAVEAIKGGAVDGVLLFSPRTAKTFAHLAVKAGLEKKCAALTAWCLSPAVADQAAALDWRRICVATRPRQQDLLDRIFAENS